MFYFIISNFFRVCFTLSQLTPPTINANNNNITINTIQNVGNGVGDGDDEFGVLFDQIDFKFEIFIDLINSSPFEMVIFGATLFNYIIYI